MTNQGDSQRTPDVSPTLSFKAGGWVIVLAALLSLALLAWGLAGLVFGDRPIGNGRDIETYDFSLEPMTVPLETLAVSGNPRDFLKTYRQPKTIPGGDVIVFNEQIRGRWLVSADRVVGVVIDGEARAYPIRCLNAHEIIEDTLAGVPIVVTYSPFADAAIVLKNGSGSEKIDFGVSGLLCNSSLLMYDRNAKDPSLWSPVMGEVITGPRAGERFEEIEDVNICTWRSWLQAHPDTSLILPDQEATRRYKEFSYLRYFNDISDSLEYTVEPLPVTSRRDSTIPRLKARVIAVTVNQTRRVWPLTMLVEALDAKTGRITVKQDGVPIVFELTELPQAALVSAPEGTELRIQPRLWFSWFCSHPESAMDELVRELPSDALIEPRGG